MIKDSTHEKFVVHEKPIQFVEFKTDLRVRDTDEFRSYILLKKDYESFSAVCIIYHDDEHKVDRELKLNYWIVVAQTREGEKKSFESALKQIKEQIHSKSDGLPKLFDNVGEKCYKGSISGSISGYNALFRSLVEAAAYRKGKPF